MQSSQPSLFTRGDTMFGVCEALGEDFRFNPIFLRVALAGILLWNPLVAVGGYLALGLVVLLSRLIAPNPRMVAEPAEAPQLSAGDDQAAPELAAAA